MISRIAFLMTLLILYLFLDLYTYFGLRSLFESKSSIRIFQVVYLATSILVWFGFYKVYQVMNSGSIFTTTGANFFIGIVITAIVTKLIYVGLMIMQDASRFLWGLLDYLRSTMGNGAEESKLSYVPSRRRFVTLAATGLAAVPLLSMLYGITKGKYNYKVKNLKLSFADLPKAFDGFKIVQISDIHAGSFDDKEAVARGVDLIKDQKADMIVFTGDLVNFHKDEINPFLDTFAGLEAPYGMYSILGNHDYYGWYRKAPESQEDYVADFRAKHEYMGFNLMLNENKYIEKDGEKINLVGVENWGSSRHFPKKGNLNKALEGTQNEDFSILLSHDPSHWDHKVIEHQKHIHLTMSGHTHGMQFGVDIPGLKWSPVKYRYPRWAGLYEEKGQYLYVNKGFGFLAFPGRVGMWPEITVIELNAV